MAALDVASELERWGPETSPRSAPSLEESLAYCRRLAETHYENFTVASWLLPARLRKHFHVVYAYCRWADDLADETAGGEESLRLLDWWEGELHECYAGRARHPVFVALKPTVDEFGIPPRPLLDLLRSFRQDQVVKRYETADQLIDYCRGSADPVGRLVLYLGRSFRDEWLAESDSVCTGLQWANFCQDVARDWDRGRIYLPQATLKKHGVDEATFAARTATPAFRAALAEEVDRAEGFLRRGAPLVERLPPELAIDVDLFVRGGLAILEAVRRIDHDVWTRRPEVSKARKLWLLCQAAARRLRRACIPR